MAHPLKEVDRDLVMQELEAADGMIRGLDGAAVKLGLNCTQDQVRILGISGRLKELLDSERLATIGRMASSISHDVRHYLSVMYANAEFMSDGSIAQSERDELFHEVRSAVRGTSDLLIRFFYLRRHGPTSVALLSE